MSRALSVKVSTAKVIKALEAKLEAGTKAIASNEKKRKEYKKVENAWNKEVAELATKHFAKAEVSANENWRGEISIDFRLPAGTFTLPPKPELELEQELGRYEVEEINNAIRILKMTDEEVVNATTFKSIAQYL